MKPTPAPRVAPGRHVYDVIVFGGQLAGALSAALLARRGFKVLLVPHDGLGSPYLHQGFLLPHAPFLMPPPKAIEALEELASEVGLTVPLHRSMSRPSLQLLRPGSWFDFRSDPKDRPAELKRGLGAQADAFEEDWQRAVAAADASDAFVKARLDLPPEGMVSRWRLGRQLPRFTGLELASPLPQGSILRALLPLAAPLATPGPLTETRALGRLLTWPSVFPGGREGLYQLFSEKARELGADVMGPTETVEQLAFHGSTAASVRLTGMPATYRAEVYVAAMDLEAIGLLVPEGRRGTFQKAAAALPVRRHLLTLNAIVPESALPRGLGTLALIEGAPTLVLQVTPARGPAVGAEASELRTLTVAMETSAPLTPTDPAASAALVEAVWQRLETVMPFTRARARLESAPVLHAPSLLDGRADPSALFELPADAWFGITGTLTQSPAKRLLLASRQVLPGLGLEGEVLAAARAVQRVERTLKRQDPLRARPSA